MNGHEKYQGSYSDLEIDKAKAKLAYIVRDVDHGELTYHFDSGGGWWQCEVGGYDILIGISQVDEGSVGITVYDKDTEDHLFDIGDWTVNGPGWTSWIPVKKYIEENYG